MQTVETLNEKVQELEQSRDRDRERARAMEERLKLNGTSSRHCRTAL